MVALGLMFGIQQLDPMPFCLFDENDVALNARYRTAVATMVIEAGGRGHAVHHRHPAARDCQGGEAHPGSVEHAYKVSKVRVLTLEEALYCVGDAVEVLGTPPQREAG